MAMQREVADENKFAKLNRVRAMVGLGAYPIKDPCVNPNPRDRPRDRHIARAASGQQRKG
jgi:hypothetical protein